MHAYFDTIRMKNAMISANHFGYQAIHMCLNLPMVQHLRGCITKELNTTKRGGPNMTVTKANQKETTGVCTYAPKPYTLNSKLCNKPLEDPVALRVCLQTPRFCACRAARIPPSPGGRKSSAASRKTRQCSVAPQASCGTCIHGW